MTPRNALNRAVERLTGYHLTRGWTSVELAIEGIGQLSFREARALGDLVRSCDPQRPIIEIGTLFGFSTTVCALHKHPDQPLVTVDNFSWNPLGLPPDIHRRAVEQRLRSMTESNVRLVASEKEEFYSTYDLGRPALVFLDADHGYEATARDIDWALSVGADIICGDDYGPHCPGVVRAVDEAGGASEVVEHFFVLRR